MNKLTITEVMKLVETMADVAIENEVPFCKLDSYAGDGDFGMSIAKGFKQLKADWAELDTEDIGSFLKSCSMIIMEYCGGASGPIWGSGFRGAAKVAKGLDSLSLADLAAVMQETVAAIQKTGARSFGRGAVVGDKTLIDALVPCADYLSEAGDRGEDLLEAMAKAAEAAVQGAEKTKEFGAKMGRAANVGERSLSYPDAGAFALGVIFTKMVEAIS